MERVILRHLKGSKASQLEEFPIAQSRELVLGRDPSAAVRFDADRDDLVGRQHARITQDPNDRYRYTLVDLNSRNGTFLNKLRVVAPMPLNPGDVVQLGAGGPEVQFDIDPLPPHMMKTTRLSANAAGAGVTETRNGAAVGATAAGNGAGNGAGAAVAAAPVGFAAGFAPPADAKPAIGKATVERLITETKKESSRNMMVGGAAALVVIASVAAWLLRDSRTSQEELAKEAQRAQAQAASATAAAKDIAKRTSAVEGKTEAMTPAQIAAANNSAIVQVAFSWKLVYRPTGGQVFHKSVPNKYKDKQGQERPIIDNGRQAIPAYTVVGDNRWEPLLTLDQNSGTPIGASSGGSGFVVTSDGFILTNRHVAANWKTNYSFGQGTEGVLFSGGKMAVDENGTPQVVQAPYDWTPSETKQAGGREFLKGAVELNQFEARQEYLYVSFPGNTNHVEAQISRISDRHDVTLIKVSVPQPLQKVELYDNYGSIAPGDAAIVMGYPGIANYAYAVIRSRDWFNQETQNKVVPEPTVSVGNVGKLIRGMDNPVNGKDFVYTNSGDTYQLTINSTGGGNSGGPMFDDHGRVTGIYFAGKSGDAQISFSVPIKYGLELMTVAPNAK